MEGDPGVTQLRAGITAILEKTIQRAVRAHGGLAPQSARAEELEKAIFAASKPASAASGQYTATAKTVDALLTAQLGPFPSDVLAVKYLRGGLAAAEVVKIAQDPPPEPDEREQVRRLFVRVLTGPDAAYEKEWEAALDLARALETGCYNAVIRMSRESEDPPRRQWDSPAFVNMYSGRCGAIACLLDPRSQTCQKYGATLAQKLKDGRVTPDEAGAAATPALCPEATAREKALIEKRAAQKVEEKESNLFRCPHCGERRCTYRQVQVRGADEPPDYFCTCLNPVCRRQFKGRS